MTSYNLISQISERLRGEVAEWSNAPDSKSGVRFYRTVSSNLTLSAKHETPQGVFCFVERSEPTAWLTREIRRVLPAGKTAARSMWANLTRPYKHETPQGVFCWVDFSPSFTGVLLGALLPVNARRR
jgi:hypothetical protein